MVNGDNTINVIYTFEESRGLRHEHHDLYKYFVACTCNVHRLCVRKLCFIAINEIKPVYCSKTCKEGFPNLTLDMIADSEKRQPDENRRRLGVWTRGQQRKKMNYMLLLGEI